MEIGEMVPFPFGLAVVVHGGWHVVVPEDRAPWDLS